jgi:molybdopterin molybdotransferase
LINTEDSINGILAEDIHSNIDFPFYDSALMDGYALRIKEEWCGGGLKNETTFKIVGKKARSLENFEAVKIMTGEAVPENANVLIKIEDIVSGGFLKNEELVLPEGFEFQCYKNIKKKGEDIKKGDLLLEKNSLILPSHIGILGYLKKPYIKVCRRPSASLFSFDGRINGYTGFKEDASSFVLISLLKSLGVKVNYFGIKKDKEDLLEGLKDALKSDIVIISGGITGADSNSAAADCLASIGCKKLFQGLNIKPGKPFTAEIYDETAFFILPKNIFDTIVLFEKFIRPAALKMSGFKDLLKPVFKFAMEDEIKKKDDRTHFVLAEGYKKQDGLYYAKKAGPQTLSSLKNFNVLLTFGEESRGAKAGEEAEGYFIY